MATQQLKTWHDSINLEVYLEIVEVVTSKACAHERSGLLFSGRRWLAKHYWLSRVGSCNNDVLQDFKIAILKQSGSTAEQVQ